MNKVLLATRKYEAMTMWDNPKRLDNLEGMRQNQRKNKGRLTFDCFNTRCRGDRVICIKQKRLARGD